MCSILGLVATEHLDVAAVVSRSVKGIDSTLIDVSIRHRLATNRSTIIVVLPVLRNYLRVWAVLTVPPPFVGGGRQQFLKTFFLLSQP